MNAFLQNVQGKVLSALAVNEHKAQGVSNLRQLEDYGLMRPTLVEAAGKKDHDFQAAKAIRSELNRSFKTDKSRRDNAEDYSGYIENVEVNGHIGGTPAVTLYHEATLETDGDGNLLVPYSGHLVAIDGETQTEARYILRDRIQQTEFTPVAFTIYHGIPYDEAKQILHDYNAYGKRVSETVLGNFNTSGPLTSSVNEALAAAGVEMARVNTKGTKAGVKSVLATRQMMTAAAAFQRAGLALEQTIGAEHMLRLNKPGAAPLNDLGKQMLVDLAGAALANPAIGKAPVQLWQVAGFKCSAGSRASQFNWQAAMHAFESTKAGGRGGPRIPVKERLETIAAAM